MTAAPHCHRRARPWLQQREHLRQPAAPDERRPPFRESLGAPLLRAGAEIVPERCRRRAGPRTADGGGYIHSFNGPHSLFVDTIRTLRVLAIAHQLGQVLKARTASASACSTASPGTPWRPRAIPSSMARAATPMTCAAAWRTKASSIRAMAATGAPTPSRATRPSAPGRAAWRGPCAASPSWLEFFDALPGPHAATSVFEKAAAPPATFTSPTRRPTASRIGIPARRVSSAWATGARIRPIR